MNIGALERTGVEAESWAPCAQRQAPKWAATNG